VYKRAPHQGWNGQDWNDDEAEQDHRPPYSN
jgi:hypothetical protein